MKLRWILACFTAALSACNPIADTKIGRAYFAGVDISLTKSALSVSATAVQVGGTVDITLALKDQSGQPYVSERSVVSFTAVGGTSLGTIGTVTNRGNGIYTAVYTATNAGTAQTIVATVDGKTLTGTAPTILVINGSFSLAHSVVTVSSPTVTSGSGVTVTLTVKDSSNSQLSSGGETVTFARSGGTSSGTFGAVTDHNDGTYTATFTGTTAGTATNITATIATLAVTSTPPTVTVNAGTEASVTVSSGNSQSATAGAAVTNPLVAVVKDTNGNVKSGVTVTWAVTAGGGSLSSCTTTTSASGLVQCALTTGTTAGTNTVTATVSGIATPATFTATGTVGAAASIDVSSGDAQSATAGSAVTNPLVAIVKDANGNVKSGVTVTWAVTAGGGSLSSCTTTTNASGLAQCTLTTGTTAGTNTVTASVSGVATPATFTATGNVGAAASITMLSGNSQSATAGSALTNPLVAVVKDANSNVKSGVTVTWAVTAGGGSLSSCTTTTDSSGLVQCDLTTGTTAGTNTVTASVSGIATPATFTATGTVGAAASITVSSGDGQSATAGSALGSALVAVVKDANANVKSGVTVTWAVTAGGGSLSSCTTTTSASGLVQCSLTTGTTAGTNTVTASVAGIATPATFNATGNVGSASKLVFVQQPTNTASGGTLTPAVTVKAQDANSNDVTSYATDITVAISTNPASGTLSGTLTQTPSSGVSTFNDLSINYYGTGYRITASSGALTAAVSNLFNITATAVTYDWPFTALTTADYTSSDSWASMDFAGGVCRLTATVQTDSEATETSQNAITNGTEVGVVYGTLANGVTQGVKLGSGGSCNGTTTDCAKQTAAEIYELSSTWTPQWANLVSYWKFNNDWNDAKGTNHATAGGSAMFGSAAKIGSHAGVFNGTSSYLSTPNAGVNPGTTPLTAMAWVYLDTTGGGEKKIVQQLDGTGAGRVLISYAGSAFMSYIGGTWTYSATIPAAGVWYHLAMTSTGGTGSTVTIYVNGKLETTQVVNAEAATGSYAIGAHKTYAANFFPGKLDDIAIWSTALSADDIATIYDRQRPGYSGTFTSRVMDAKSASSWTTLSWIPTLPFMKELPDATCATPCTHNAPENSTNYTSLVGSTGSTSDATISTSQLVGLWHLNEASGTTGSGTVKDDSGRANHGTPDGTISLGTPGRLSSAMSVSTANAGSINIPHHATLDFGASQDFSISTWVKTTQTPTVSKWPTFIDKDNDAGVSRTGFSMFSMSETTNLPSFGVSINGLGYSVSGTTAINDGRWHHVLGQRIGTTLEIWVDGVRQGFSTNASISGSVQNTTNLGIGNRTVDNSCCRYSGKIDEVAVWSRALHADEIKQLYQRGASRIKFQVRSCNDVACSGESWQGPDGSSGTFFSELNNNSTPLDGSGNVSATLPSMLFSGFTNPPGNNRYFQYRAILESDSSTAALMPELKSTTVDPIHYDASSPSIYGNNGVAFSELNAFTETLGANGCSSAIGYNLSLDKSTWKYWNGSAWVTANGTATQSNPAATVHANTATFGTQVGKGTVYVKAYLKSSGTSQCEIDNLQLGGNR